MKNVCVILVVVLLAMSGCAQVDKTADANGALAMRIANEVWNDGNMDVVDEILAPNYVRHNPKSWEPAMVDGPEAFKEYVGMVHDMYPDFKLEVHNRMASGDMVASNWTVTGTHKESGKPISVDGLVMTRYENGKAVEEWMTFDTLSLAKQIGMVPADDMSMK